ncbi:hypothetical protein TRAPUB_4118 [Trametes pubescens]|uniref:Uncharacterized protein n=1 Tax=Trametes pubescens TaxID=154538 RepID=A0A1M2VBZ4_TRAPU|nr:hypothetical protein TRAPUB_4118 [Trametes pubescens]
MVTNGGNTEGLFRGGIMHAGSPLPTGDIESIQPAYDIVIEQAGCAAAADTLECLRQVPAATLLKAGAALPNLFDLPPHGSDATPVLTQGNDLADYVIQFTNTLDPNGASNRTIPWPRYDPLARSMLTLLPGDTPLEIVPDTARLEAMAGLTGLSIAFPL